MDPLSTLNERLADLVADVGNTLLTVAAGRRHPSTATPWAEDLAVTTSRALRGASTATVRLPDGNVVEAAVVGTDAGTDLAVLRVPGLKPPRWSEGHDLRVGHLVVVLGRPGENAGVDLGIVSGLGGAWQSPHGGSIDRWIDVQGSLPPGYSGGPLVALDGSVVGVNSRGLLRGGTTVPTATVRRVVEELLAHGRVRRGWLGIGAQGATLAASDATVAGQPRAVLVGSVATGSPAEAGGLRVGDLLVSLDGQALQGVEDLWAALSGDRVDRDLVAVVLRGGVRVEVTLRPSVRPEPQRGGRCG
jgi:S1-C subfamily serine protease